jgi:gamma-glutamyltranspeptidase/glutathione hydrolase
LPVWDPADEPPPRCFLRTFCAFDRNARGPARGAGWASPTVLQILVDRVDLGLTLPQAIAELRLSQGNTSTTQVEPAFLGTPEATALSVRGHVFSTTPEIGAATGIEFLGGGQLLAAAEPVRRGGGSAMVVSTSP